MALVPSARTPPDWSPGRHHRKICQRCRPCPTSTVDSSALHSRRHRRCRRSFPYTRLTPPLNLTDGQQLQLHVRPQQYSRLSLRQPARHLPHFIARLHIPARSQQHPRIPPRPSPPPLSHPFVHQLLRRKLPCGSHHPFAGETRIGRSPLPTSPPCDDCDAGSPDLDPYRRNPRWVVAATDLRLPAAFVETPPLAPAQSALPLSSQLLA